MRDMFKPLCLVLMLTALSAGACSNAKERLGLQKKSPDEFAVVKQAPLSLPPDYTLRPPMPGMQRPQEQTTNEQARVAVFGGKAEKTAAPASASAESAFLKRAGGFSYDPDIRGKVDAESAEVDNSKKPVAQKLLGIVGGGSGEPGATVVNAPKEAARIQKNMGEGKPVTEGQTPSIEE